MLGRIALAVLLLLTPACRTADRLWRISPFEGSGARDRVNLWPLAYHSGTETSVLWPLFDVDEKGFALRPIVAKDGSSYSVLWPLASFDTQTGTGWVLPFYKLENDAGLFPLANFGELSWVGPIWWKESSGGLFPLVYFGSFNYFGPVWWSEGAGGLFPLAAFGESSYVGPVWWGDDFFEVFPLFGWNLLGSGIDHVGPVWWRRDAEAGSGWGLFPLVSYADEGRSFSLLPLYAHELGPDASSYNVLLGVGHLGESGENTERWLLPLYYQRDEPEQSDTVLLPFFWKRVRGGEADVYTLLGNRSVDPESTSLNLYPLWWSSEAPSGDAGWEMLLPLFFYEHEADERTLITPLGGRGWSASGESRFVNVLGPIYHHSESTSGDEARTAFLWPLFEHHRENGERTTRLAAGLYSATSTPEESEATYLFGLGHAARTPTGLSHRFWPLYSWSDEEESPGFVYSLTLFGRRERGESTSTRLFPLFWHESAPQRSEWNALLGLVHHDRTGGDETGSSRSWVWPLYARSTDTDGPEFLDRTTLVGSSSWPGGEHFQLGASLLYSHTAEADERARRESSHALLFFSHEEEERSGTHVPDPSPTSDANRIRHRSSGFLFDAFVSESSTYTAWQEGAVTLDEARALRSYAAPRGPWTQGERESVRAILERKGVALADDEPATLRAAIESFSAANARTLEVSHLRLPLLFGYERSADSLSWIGPLGLASYDRQPQRERFSLLYYGYRSETKNGRTSRDIFPFITWDSGPDETSWSFLWRFLHYERKGERRGGHVLFFPWGET